MRRASGSATSASSRARSPECVDDGTPVHTRGGQRGAARAASAPAAAPRGETGADRVIAAHRRGRGRRRRRRRRIGLVPASTNAQGRGDLPRRSRDPAPRLRYRPRRLSCGARRRAGAPVLATRRGRGRVLPCRAQRVQRKAAAVTRPVVVVLGATDVEPPPGIGPAADLVDLRYAPDAEALRSLIGEADGVFFWRAKKAWIEECFEDAMRLRWIQSASDGVDGLLFPALAGSDVVVTNARGVFDDPIAEWVIAAIGAFTTGLHTSVVDQARRAWVDGRQRERVAGQHLVVVGPGPIGRATAARARALGM